MYLLDTNAVSELRRRPKHKANANFEAWFKTVKLEQLFINTIVLMEQQKWALLKRHKKDEAQALLLEAWVKNLLVIFDGRILPIDNDVGLQCAKLHIPNPRPPFDSLIAATALVHNLTLVTRNEKDFVGIENLKIFNPFLLA